MYINPSIKNFRKRRFKAALIPIAKMVLLPKLRIGFVQW